uniref:Retrotransposon gag domain-containing protein n=1 Tax=Anopheles atroparvus TaxID=41427 RepID=A0AAG5D920_ANOAO
MAAQLIGTIPEFIVNFDDWNVYSERLDQFFEVNEIPTEKRNAFLISSIGSDAYKSLRELCHPSLPKDRPFEELCELLRKQFSPQVAIFRERTHFYNATQNVGENVTQWYGRLKKLSVDCKFASNLEAVLLDKFITGLRPGQVLDRLCEENETLQLEQALDIAINKECAITSTSAATE